TEHFRISSNFLSSASLRLHRHGLRTSCHWCTVHGCMGTPHVRNRCSSASVLLVHDLPYCGSNRYEVLQLGRHHVEGPHHLGYPNDLGHGLYGHLPLRWYDRRYAGSSCTGLPPG